jgi:hypothetical protein
MRPAGSEDNGAHNIRHQPTESDKVGGESGRQSLHQLCIFNQQGHTAAAVAALLTATHKDWL